MNSASESIISRTSSPSKSMGGEESEIIDMGTVDTNILNHHKASRTPSVITDIKSKTVFSQVSENIYNDMKSNKPTLYKGYETFMSDNKLAKVMEKSTNNAKLHKEFIERQRTKSKESEVQKQLAVNKAKATNNYLLSSRNVSRDVKTARSGDKFYKDNQEFVQTKEQRLNLQRKLKREQEKPSFRPKLSQATQEMTQRRSKEKVYSRLYTAETEFNSGKVSSTDVIDLICPNDEKKRKDNAIVGEKIKKVTERLVTDSRSRTKRKEENEKIKPLIKKFTSEASDLIVLKYFVKKVKETDFLGTDEYIMGSLGFSQGVTYGSVFGEEKEKAQVVRSLYCILQLDKLSDDPLVQNKLTKYAKNELPELLANSEDLIKYNVSARKDWFDNFKNRKRTAKKLVTEYTFTPKVNKTKAASKFLTSTDARKIRHEHQKEAKIKEKEQAELAECTFGLTTRNRGSSPINKLFYESGKVTERKNIMRETKMAQKLKEEQQECKFIPETTRMFCFKQP